MRLRPVQFQLMSRAPQPGEPQRVSAHVVSKAKSFTDDEKTTSDDEQWSDEGSTTVEQGEAEKLRSLIPELPKRSGTGVSTTTGANALDEPTVDDQHADPNLSITPVPREAPGLARLIATQGNDTGHELAILV